MRSNGDKTDSKAVGRDVARRITTRERWQKSRPSGNCQDTRSVRASWATRRHSETLDHEPVGTQAYMCMLAGISA